MNNRRIAKIFIVNDHPLILYGLKNIINKEKGLTVCGTSDSKDEALLAIEALRPDMAIVDLLMNNEWCGIKLIKAIKQRMPSTLVLVFTMFDIPLCAERAIKAGAHGYLIKKEAPDKVIAAIHCILNGGHYTSKSLAMKISQSPSPINQLTDRELEIFILFSQGAGTQQIAERLQLSIKTVETHKGRIKKKLGFNDTFKLIQYAIQWGHIINKL